MPNQNLLTINYANTAIHSTSSSQSFSLTTSGTYCEENIEVAVDFLDTSDANATSADMLATKTAYVNGSKITGNIATKTSSNLSAFNATVVVPPGYYATTASKMVATTTYTNLTLTFTTATGIVQASHDQTKGYLSQDKGSMRMIILPNKTSSDLSVSDATVTVPAGYYATTATTSISNGSAATPATTITTTPTMSINTATGVVSAANSKSQSVTPTVSSGYVSAGTAGTITVSGSNTFQVPLWSGNIEINN